VLIGKWTLNTYLFVRLRRLCHLDTAIGLIACITFISWSQWDVFCMYIYICTSEALEVYYFMLFQEDIFIFFRIHTPDSFASDSTEKHRPCWFQKLSSAGEPGRKKATTINQSPLDPSHGILKPPKTVRQSLLTIPQRLRRFRNANFSMRI
jgi:hypothetical protein